MSHRQTAGGIALVAAVVWLGAMLLAGCEGRPKAPAGKIPPARESVSEGAPRARGQELEPEAEGAAPESGAQVREGETRGVPEPVKEPVAALFGPVSRVSDREALVEAVKAAEPGARILVEPGEYRGGMYFKGVRGEKGEPIVIAAADPKRPPRIEGGYVAFQFSGAEHLELRDLVCVGATKNGLNFDGGSEFFKLINLTVKDVDPKGNHDGIKMSGVSDFHVENCTVQDWGHGGDGIDMVACTRGVIEGCVFRNEDLVGASGVQTKGGSTDIVIRRNRFEHAGRRGVNIGGSTSFSCFWLGLPEKDAYESKGIVVEGNVFVGCKGAICFVTSEGGIARFNTIYHPTRWAFRILQEQSDPRFVKCRNGIVEDNIIVYKSTNWVEGGLNFLTKSADSHTFKFARNWWYCEDKPEKSMRRLPPTVRETDGVIGKDPILKDPKRGDFSLKEESPAKGRGHTALPSAKKSE